MNIETALETFVSDYVEHYQQTSSPLVVQFDSEWLSPCHQAYAEEDEWVSWLPVKQIEPLNFSDFETALDIKMNAELKSYFALYFSDNLSAKTERGDLELLLPWNQDDAQRLQQNLIAHVLMKRRLKQPDTLFFAVTDEEDFIISVENDSGRVMLEQIGLVPTECLAPNLSAFIRQLTPRS